MDEHDQRQVQAESNENQRRLREEESRQVAEDNSELGGSMRQIVEELLAASLEVKQLAEEILAKIEVQRLFNQEPQEPLTDRWWPPVDRNHLN